uniref:HTH CENPB-type domain-containing protein n=1 Tax=Trichogramma kaykai TaxID=54128 RepID=A0ABD2WSE1_9HYME
MVSPNSKIIKKRDKKVKSIADKIQILNLLKSGYKVAEVARSFEVNESTIRSIKKNEEKTRESAAQLGPYAKVNKISRKPNMEKMEEILILWIQDLIQKKIPLSTSAIREQALLIIDRLNQQNSTSDFFSASKGWFEKFKDRYSLRNIAFSGESASTDHEAAEAFPHQLRELISQKDSLTYVSEFWEEIKNSTLNRSWSKLLPEVVMENNQCDADDMQSVVQQTIGLAKDVGGEGFEDIQEDDVLELVSKPENPLTITEIEEIIDQQPLNEVEEAANEEAEDTFSFKNVARILSRVQSAIDEALEEDPFVIRSLRFRHDCERAMASYQQLYKDLSKGSRQTRLTDYFKKS